VLAGAGLLATRGALHTAVDTAPEVGHVEHRLHGAVVAALIAVVVIIAAGITAAVVFSGKSTSPKPPHTGGVVPTTHALASAHPATGRGGGNPLGGVVLASTTTSLAAGGASSVNLGNGVTLTVASGWTVNDQGQSEAAVINGQGVVFVAAVVAHAGTTNIGQAQAQAINGFIKGAGLTNVQQEQDGQMKAVQGNNFTQMLLSDFTGDIQTNQGTQQVYGLWMTLLNPSTQLFGFINLTAPSEAALNAALPDAKSMIASML
jgi:hypothetical protein